MTVVKSLDTPSSAWNFDDTILTQISSAAYTEGVPEVGVTFMAPTSGRVVITIGGGLRDNGSNATRIFMAPQVFLGTDSSGTEILAPTVGQYGIGSAGEQAEFMYYSRTANLTGLTAGRVYYARVMYQTSNTPASPSADIACREIGVAPG
ncbi:hypothetical protein [Microbispora bryophytorum]|uniref:hypothetical protein n=1 Tax=Microbispora bryophytorum TaxID=1460882 RepID=UPI0033DE6530